MDILQQLTELAQAAYDSLKGSAAEQEALQDLQDLKALAEQHEHAAGQWALQHAEDVRNDVLGWFSRRLHPARPSALPEDAG